MPAIPDRNLTVHIGQDDRIHRMGPTREHSRLHPVQTPRLPTRPKRPAPVETGSHALLDLRRRPPDPLRLTRKVPHVEDWPVDPPDADRGRHLNLAICTGSHQGHDNGSPGSG